MNNFYIMERLLRLLKESTIPSDFYDLLWLYHELIHVLIFSPNVTYPGVKSGDIYFYYLCYKEICDLTAKFACIKL